MGNETVSIIMPAYNAEETIKDSILSILKQTYEDFKLYIINDNSSDSTEHIIKSIIDERIVYLLNRNGKGVSSARNVGIAACNSRYIAFCDSDDVWFETKLEEQLKILSAGNYKVVCSNYEVFYADTNVIKERRFKEVITYNNMLQSNHIGNLTGIYDSTQIGKVYQQEIGHEDYLMWLTIVKKAKLVYCIQKNLARYYIHNTGLSSNKFTAAMWQWNIYRRVLSFSLFKSLVLFFIYSVRALAKRL
ncbi:TPA: glycosyltransferase family 2 protein [Escherichia coli]